MYRARNDDPDTLDLLPQWREPVSTARILRAGLGSLGVHAAVVALFLILPSPSTDYRGQLLTVDLRRAVPLVAPKLTELTQKDPNKDKVTNQLDARSALPPLPKARTFRPPAPAGPVSEPAAGALPEPPQIQAAAAVPDLPGVPPSIPKSVENPKVVFENVGTPEHVDAQPGAIPTPRASVSDLARIGTRPGGGGGAASGDDGGAAAVPQLLSDPQGVDFKPYLLQVRSLVLRRWLTVVPENARRGQRGQVVIHFVIDRRGGVPKLVIATPSGIASFDRAAVAGIQAALPLPPLPPAFKGDEIRLQMAFSYNLTPPVR
jgi:TonB family protein